MFKLKSTASDVTIRKGFYWHTYFYVKFGFNTQYAVFCNETNETKTNFLWHQS